MLTYHTHRLMKDKQNSNTERKLKFLFVSADKFPPFRVDVSVLFGKQLANKGHSIHWILQSDDNCSEAYQTSWNGGLVWVGAMDNGKNITSRLKKHLLRLTNEFRIFRLLSNNNYDFIQVKDEFFSAILAIIATRNNKAKFFYWLSYPFPEADLYDVKAGLARYPFIYYIRGHFSKWLMYKIILPRASHIFVQSEQMKKDIALMNIPVEKMSAVPMGVSLETIPYQSESIRRKDINSNRNNIVYLGTLQKSRKMDFLVRVLKLVLEDIDNCTLYFVGGSEDLSEQAILTDESKRLGVIDNVIITGFLPRQEAFEYVKQADVCVSPFFPTPILNSTSPTKLVEYMAMGKPVVANDHPEQKLMIQESEAGFCVPYNEKAFAEAIIYILRNPASSQEMGRKGRHYVENKRSYEKIADYVEGEYFRLLQTELI